MVRAEMATMHFEAAGEDAGAEHVPVLAGPVVELLAGVESARSSGGHSGWIVDGTAGLGGHSALLLEALPGIRVLASDQDPAAVERAQARLAAFGDRARVRRGRLSGLTRLVREEGIEPVVGVLLDLGVSSMQLAARERGFSFQGDGPLDMRMDPARDRTAADIVNRWDAADLADLFFHEGGESRARAVARAIVEARRQAPFLRTAALADTIARAVGHSGSGSRGAKIHPATRVFQALRRAVNEEGEELLAGLAAAERVLVPGGRLVVIAFHSGEDREVKRFLAQAARENRLEILTRKPIGPDERERRENPRSRSAHLRAAQVGGGGRA